MKRGVGACLETLWLLVGHQAHADSLAIESKNPRKAEPVRGSHCALGPRGKGVGMGHTVG